MKTRRRRTWCTVSWSRKADVEPQLEGNKQTKDVNISPALRRISVRRHVDEWLKGGGLYGGLISRWVGRFSAHGRASFFSRGAERCAAVGGVCGKINWNTYKIHCLPSILQMEFNQSVTLFPATKKCYIYLPFKRIAPPSPVLHQSYPGYLPTDGYEAHPLFVWFFCCSLIWHFFN